MTAVVAVDFDGTLVEHAYPGIGAEVPGAFDTLRRLQTAGVRLILWTMRDGQTLQDAVDYCRARGVEWWGVNANPDQGWSASPKAYAHIYVDDAGLGCPVTLRPGSRRVTVDWTAAGPMPLTALGLPADQPAPVPA